MTIINFELAKRKRISEAVKLSWQLRKSSVVIDQVTSRKCRSCSHNRDLSSANISELPIGPHDTNLQVANRVQGNRREVGVHS
jgi:hypothetical protein